MSKIDLDNVLVGDIESIGYLEELNSFKDLHVFSCGYKSDGKWNIKSTNKKEDIEAVKYVKSVLAKDNTLNTQQIIVAALALITKGRA